jgi:hypothetical protein
MALGAGSTPTSNKSSTASGTSLNLELGHKADAICRAVDPSSAFKEFGVSYVSSSGGVVLRQPSTPIENRMVISPIADESRPDEKDLRTHLVDIGVDCGIAVPLGYFAAAATCGGTAATIGAAAPLCVLSTVGAGASTLKCGHSIGKMINHVMIDPGLNDYFDQSEAWKTYENAVDAIDILASAPGIARGVKNIGALSKQASKYGKAVPRRFSIAESNKIYRELAEHLGETFSNQGTKRWINEQGFSRRFSPMVVNHLLNKEILDVTRDSVNVHDNLAEIAKRGGTASSGGQIVKGAVNRAVDLLSPAASSEPNHTIHFVQQVRP